MSVNAASTTPYAFTQHFEGLVAVCEATFVRFHEQVGHAIDPDRITHPPAALVVRAAQAVARETGSPCSCAVTVLQRARRMADDGKIPFALLDEAQALLDAALPVDDLSAVIEQTAAVLRRVMHQETLREAISEYGKEAGNVEQVGARAEKLDRVARLGVARSSGGMPLLGTVDDIMAVSEASLKDPLSTGVVELDLALGGGLESSAMGVVCGGPGSGKSLYLCGIAVDAAVNGYDVAYMTLELGVKTVKRRMYCNMLDMTKEELAKDPVEASRRHRMLTENGLGEIIVTYESPKATTPATVRAWLRDMERERGFRPRVIIVDYADLLVANIKSSSANKYDEMDVVYDALRSIAVDRDGWMWTASQMTRDGLHKKRAGSQHVADSLNKVRKADLMISIPRTEEDEQTGLIRFNVPKRREGEGAFAEVGPLPMDAARGRIIATSRSLVW